MKRFIFGQASTLLKSDVTLMLALGGVLLLLVALFWKELKLATLDRDFAKSWTFSSLP